MITKMILSAVLNTPANLENSPVAIGLEKVIFIPAPKKGNPRESSNHHIIALLSQVSKAMLKILQARLQQFVNMEFPDPAGLGSSIACHPERGGGVYGPPAPAQPDLKSPQGAG